CFVSTLHPPTSTLFPYTTLFRSVVLQSALLVSACSDDSSPGTPSFATSTDTSSSSASSTTNATLVPPTTTLTPTPSATTTQTTRSEEHTSELQSRENLVCRLLLE